MSSTPSRKEEGAMASTPASSSSTSSALFELMTKFPVGFVFMSVIPIVWIVLIVLSSGVDEKVEDEVYNIWTRQRSDYRADLDYTETFDRDSASGTSFLALAVSRDDGNIFTPERLEEVRTRMEETERTTIDYKGETYTWDDVCASNNAGKGTTYEFPCLRLSPMDFFEEASWFIDETDRKTWYDEVVKKAIVGPRLPRFGIMQGICSNLTANTGNTQCDATLWNRLKPGGNPLLLFADIGNLEMNHPCRICIETEFENTVDLIYTTTKGIFEVLVFEMSQAGEMDLVQKYMSILGSFDKQAVIDFYSYYVARSLYAELGAAAYVEGKNAFDAGFCQSVPPCKDPTTLEQAKVDLAAHADSPFSSEVTAGLALPYFDDEGNMVLGPGKPYGGSGIDMSGRLLSTTRYLDLQNYRAEGWSPLFDYMNGTVSSSDPVWMAAVETDPVYRWFMGAVTEMTAHCGNGFMKGTNIGFPQIDGPTAEVMKNATSFWCTEHTVPFNTSETHTQQYFARMWYDLLIDSPSFLNLKPGESGPYTWTIGQGCGYNLGGRRYSYRSNSNDQELLGNVSGELYYIDEGESIGALDRSLLMGGVRPANYSVDNPLEQVTVVQAIYPALRPEDIVNRVKNCNRPGGSVEISEEEATEILKIYKEEFENSWAKGWDDEKSQGDVQFVGFFDDAAVVGTTGRMLRDITLDNGVLVAVSIVLIAAFSVLFVFTCDVVDSRIMITLLGVCLVLLAFFAAIGFGLLIGIKINITIAWTLPFIMLGLGVDDMYIVMLALKKQKGYGLEDYLRAMKEVVVPVSMTSLVNAGMFAVMNLNDVPAIFLTAQIALISVVFMYFTIVFCFPAWCYLDMRRQAAGRCDALCCLKRDQDESTPRAGGKLWASFMYDYVYKPLLLEGPSVVIAICHVLVWLGAAALFGLGVWGLTDGRRKVGLGLEDFFPESHQAGRWATLRTEELASWPVSMNWGAVEYTNPDIQMRVIKQFEDVVATDNIAEVDTKRLWLADFNLWTTHQCTDNFGREVPEILECGKDQLWLDNSTCSGTWKFNKFDLREKDFGSPDTCAAFEKGVCRPRTQMHPLDLEGIDDDRKENESSSWCPVFEGWSNAKLQFCLGKWREFTGGSGRLLLANETGTPTECAGEFNTDETVVVPIPFATGPSLFAIDMFTHEITLDMLRETRAVCDDDEEVHCFMSGIPYQYWSQYLGIFDIFFELGGLTVAIGFVVSLVFLLSKLMSEGRHGFGQIFVGSIVGALLITITCVISLIAVSGISSLAGVSFTGFSLMSFVLSVGFAVEYSVHVIARWLRAPQHLTTSMERVEYTMSFLMLPTFMSFVSSAIGVACLAFTDFKFNIVFFFRPLMIVMFVTYFLGCWWLPVCLTLLDFDAVKLGGNEDDEGGIIKEPATKSTEEKHVPGSGKDSSEDYEDSPPA